MSESREHKRRYNARLVYIAEFDRWLKEEPSMLLFWQWRAWKHRRPIIREDAEHDRTD